MSRSLYTCSLVLWWQSGVREETLEWHSTPQESERCRQSLRLLLHRSLLHTPISSQRGLMQTREVSPSSPGLEICQRRVRNCRWLKRNLKASKGFQFDTIRPGNPIVCSRVPELPRKALASGAVGAKNRYYIKKCRAASEAHCLSLQSCSSEPPWCPQPPPPPHHWHSLNTLFVLEHHGHTPKATPKWGPQRETRQRARRSSMMFG